MYMLVGLRAGVPGIIPPENMLQESYDLHKWLTVVLMFVWSTLAAVRLSFLLFFKRLIGQVQSLNIFWWITVVFNISSLGCGIVLYFVSCPYYNDPRMVLGIPICVIWRIRVHWTQKIVLMLSLCLTVFIIAITIVRMAGFASHGQVDIIWEVYWLILAAEVGLIMAAAITFRIFFVSWNAKKASPPEQVQHFFSESGVGSSGGGLSDPYMHGFLEHVKRYWVIVHENLNEKLHDTQQSREEYTQEDSRLRFELEL
ncbi:hypothetical protein N0V90_010118 [Kalmusia sp. IMI 367209]|nr:hypothetical protein N0V90_010118 [Kalmusia sp. IMI 367209]